MTKAPVSSPPPLAFWRLSALLVALFWSLAALRHHLLQSTGDLAIFDQVAWAMSRGLEPHSTISGMHHMGDHGAWLFYAIAPLYWLTPSVHWLFLTQALALILTAWPLWYLGVQAGLTPRLRWLVCGLWWLQPVVFNVNLFGFHPEVWAMPFLALAVWANRAERRRLWIACLFLAMGCKAAMGLVVIGMALEQALRRRWRWAVEALLIGGGWLLFVMEVLFPALNGDTGLVALGRHQGRYSHLGESVGDILQNAVFSPGAFLAALDWANIVFYLFLLSLPLAFYWRRSSLPMLAATLPLLAINILSSWKSQQDVIHQYSLPLAVLLVVASMDGLVADRRHGRRWLTRRLWFCCFWATLSWALLARPGGFFGPYLSRADRLGAGYAFIQRIPADAAVLTHKDLAAHVTHRPVAKALYTDEHLNPAEFDVAFFDRKTLWNDPRHTAATIEQLKALGWTCDEESQFVLCQKT